MRRVWRSERWCDNVTHACSDQRQHPARFATEQRLRSQHSIVSEYQCREVFGQRLSDESGRGLSEVEAVGPARACHPPSARQRETELPREPLRVCEVAVAHSLAGENCPECVLYVSVSKLRPVSLMDPVSAGKDEGGRDVIVLVNDENGNLMASELQTHSCSPLMSPSQSVARSHPSIGDRAWGPKGARL